MNRFLINTVTGRCHVALPYMLSTSHIQPAYWKKTSPCFHFTGVFPGFMGGLCGNVGTKAGLGSVQAERTLLRLFN